MKADPRFTDLDLAFWANVRSISETLGYTVRRTKTIRVYALGNMIEAMRTLGLEYGHLVDQNGNRTAFAKDLHDYFKHRAEVLNEYVEPRLMDATRARDTFEDLRSKLSPRCPLPMNKQKDAKKAHNFLTCIVNMLVEAGTKGLPCDYDPRRLTTLTQEEKPARTLSRRLDGCFPGTVNPVAVWEIKEYYYTTTFGSRVADGVYETLLDGYEISEGRENLGVDVQHLLVVDAYGTWWELGRSYLCRIIDMLHMGYVDEVLFGYETVERLPEIIKSWVSIYNSRIK